MGDLMPQLRDERLGIVCLPLAPTQVHDHGTFGAAISLSNFKSGRVLWGASQFRRFVEGGAARQFRQCVANAVESSC